MGRKVIGIIVVFLLLAPATLQAFVWTAINLWVAILAVAMFIAAVRFSPKLKWPSAIVASLFIAIAPYPNWIWASNEEGWQFHVGYKLQHIADYAVQFGVFFAIAILLFMTLYWAMRPLSANVQAP